MSKDIDWSGSWPALVLPGGFTAWARQRLRLGLELALLVMVVFVGIAAKRAGSELAGLGMLAAVFIAVLSRVEWIGAGRRHEH